MLARFFFPAVVLFWLTMNVLLWRAEYGSHASSGSAVPAEAVWRKMLTSPDSSSLNIFYRGKKIGFCHWKTRVSEDAENLKESPATQNPPRSGYHVQLDGSWRMSITNRAHFDGSLDLANGRELQKIKMRLELRSAVFELESSWFLKTVRLKVAGDDLNFERTFGFSELQNPAALLGEFAGTDLGGVAEGLQLPAVSASATKVADAVKWQAWSQTMQVRHVSVRVFRLETQLLNRYKVIILTSSAGEILKVELPGEIVLMHDWEANL